MLEKCGSKSNVEVAVQLVRKVEAVVKHAVDRGRGRHRLDQPLDEEVLHRGVGDVPLPQKHPTTHAQTPDSGRL